VLGGKEKTVSLCLVQIPYLSLPSFLMKKHSVNPVKGKQSGLTVSPAYPIFNIIQEGAEMSSKTQKNLAYAFAAESKASVRNDAFARKADAEGFAGIARLFRAVSEAESVHAQRYLMLMRGKIGSTEENLEAAFQSEIKANVDEYPNLIKEATAEGEEAALKAFSHARDVEDRHAELYKKAMNDMLSERETIYYVCQVCGYVAENEAPENCPVCGAVGGKFKKIE
jgi:rubrerythrin